MIVEYFSILLDQIRQEIPRIFIGLVILVFIALIYKTVSRILSRTSKRLEFSPNAENSLRLIIRVIVVVSGTTTLFTLFELPTSWFLGGSALIGAAIGFGSNQTINNIAAGFYVIISRPFKVKDYVRISDVEGQVEEISINYTKLYTPTFNFLLIPNIQVMSSRVLNYTHEGCIKYAFNLDMPHGMISSNEDIISKCIEPAIEEFHKIHSKERLRRPEIYFDTSAAFARSFKIRIFIPKGKAKTLFTLKNELSNMIMNRWDTQRKR